MLDFCEQDYCMVLPYRLVRGRRGVRMSSLGVVPQRDRRPHLIVDYSCSGVNEDTVPLVPRKAMQFGRAPQRVMTKIVRADPCYGPLSICQR
jgi:hypothetical protein